MHLLFIRPENVNFHVLHIDIDHLVLRINVLFLMSLYVLYNRAYVNKNRQLQNIKSSFYYVIEPLLWSLH